MREQEAAQNVRTQIIEAANELDKLVSQFAEVDYVQIPRDKISTENCAYISINNQLKLANLSFKPG